MGLLGCVVQLPYRPLTFSPVRASTSPAARARIVMQSVTGQTETHRLQPTHSSSFTSKWRLPFSVAVIAWWDVSSQTTWQRPHWMQRSWLMTAFSTWLRLRYCQSVIDATALPCIAATLLYP